MAPVPEESGRFSAASFFSRNIRGSIECIGQHPIQIGSTMNRYEIDVTAQATLSSVALDQLVERLEAHNVLLCGVLPSSLSDGDVLHFRLESESGVTEVTRFVRDIVHRAAPDVFVETRALWPK